MFHLVSFCLSHDISAFFITSRARSGIDSGTFQDNRTILSEKTPLMARVTDSASSAFDKPSSISAEQDDMFLADELDADDDKGEEEGVEAMRDENCGGPISQ